MTYNLSFMNGTGPHDIVIGLNQNSNGELGIMILLALYVVLFVAYSKRDFADNAIATTFIGSLVAAVMWGFDLLPSAYAIPTFAIFAIALLYKFIITR